MAITIDQFTDMFLEIERSSDICNLMVENINIWDILRYGASEQYAIKSGIIEKAHNYYKENILFKKLFFIVYDIKNMFTKLLIFKKYKYVIFGHNRRVYDENRKAWIDLPIDPIISNIENYIVYNYRIADQLNKKGVEENIAYLDFSKYIVGMLYIIIRISHSFKKKDDIWRAKRVIKRYFNIDIDVEFKYEVFLAEYYFYKILLKINNPQKVILVCSYGRESLIKACRDMNIATYEVQHGAITKNHLGYHYPFSLKKQLVPEFFLIYGEYWKTSVEYSRAIKNFKVIGNNYLYEQVKNRKMKKEKIILVLSQRTISNKIKMFVHDMSKYLPDDIKIAIKPHPGEIDTYEYEYKDENIYVIKSRYVNIYDLMAKSEWVCGVYSTAIFESIAFSCKVIILKINGWEDLYALVEKGDAVLLDRPEEIVSAINRSRIANPELYFAKSASFNL